MQDITQDLELLNTRLKHFTAERNASTDPTARDWAGFFQALADFAAVVIPLIASFFATSAKK